MIGKMKKEKTQLRSFRMYKKEISSFNRKQMKGVKIIAANLKDLGRF